jgi:hypothetical protein
MATKGQAQPQQLQPGSMFGLPGVTRWTEQQENNSGLATVETSNGATGNTNVVPPQSIIPFYQTDVAFGWNVQLTIAQTNNAGAGGTNNLSEQAPYNFFNNLKLSVNKLYSPIDVYSSYELSLYNFYRPMLSKDNVSNAGAYKAPATFPAGATVNPFSGTYSFTQSSFVVPLELPVSLWMDEYFDLDMNGNILGVSHRLPISPLFMSGEARVVTPSWQYASVLAANSDLGPFVKSGTFTTQPTVLDTFTLNIVRRGIYASNNLATMPPVYNWRLALTSRVYAPINQAKLKIPIRIALNPGGGQLLSLLVRLYDPTLNANIGGPVPLSNVSNLILTYGSGIVRYQDTVTDMKKRLMDHHQLLLPEGVIAYDMAVDDNLRISNSRALNLYLTDVFLEIDFSVLPSSSAYAVIFAETMTYVIDNVAASVGVAAM